MNLFACQSSCGLMTWIKVNFRYVCRQMNGMFWAMGRSCLARIPFPYSKITRKNNFAIGENALFERHCAAQKKVPNWRNLTFSNSTPSSLAPVSRAADPGLLCAGVAAVILLLPLPSSRRREALWIFATRRSLLYSILLKMASFELLMKAGNNCQLLNNIPLMFIYHTSNEVSTNRADFCFNTEFYGMDSCN